MGFYEILELRTCSRQKNEMAKSATAAPSLLMTLQLLMGLGLLHGCGSSEEPPVDPSPESLQCSVDDILDRNGCLACHGANAQLTGGGLNFTVDRLEESLVGVASRSLGCADEILVDPEHPEASVLLHVCQNGLSPERRRPLRGVLEGGDVSFGTP